jgi:hypothetical protein
MVVMLMGDKAQRGDHHREQHQHEGANMYSYTTHPEI